MKRIVLLKLSGEALSRVNGIGIDMEKVEDVAYEVKSLKDTGVSVGIVVGAGNIWRGRDAKKIGMDRVSADHMGMLGTILNAMALSSNGDVFAWGSNKFKQVENSDNEIVSTPVYVPVSRMTSIAAGKGDEFTTSYGVQELGKVLAWGSNENSEMGEGVIDSVTGQAIVSGGGLENIRVLEVAAG